MITRKQFFDYIAIDDIMSKKKTTIYLTILISVEFVLLYEIFVK